MQIKYKDIPFFKNISRFNKFITINDSNGCHEWNGYLDDHGYGGFKINNTNYKAHRVSFHIHKKLDNTKLVDHICRNRKCVNPEHLRLVDFKTNSVENNTGIVAINYQKTHCINGHEFLGNNFKIYSDKSRTCMICKRINARRFYAKNKT